MKNRDMTGLERVSGIFIAILTLFIIVASMEYGYINTNTPMEEIDEITEDNVEIIEDNVEIIEPVSKSISVEIIPCDEEVTPCSEEEEISSNSTATAESILAQIDDCSYVCSQQGENFVIYTISMSTSADKDKVRVAVNNACYLIKYGGFLTNDIKNVTIFVVKDSNEQLVNLICKDCSITLDNL